MRLLKKKSREFIVLTGIDAKQFYLKKDSVIKFFRSTYKATGDTYEIPVTCIEYQENRWAQVLETVEFIKKELNVKTL